MHRLLPALTHGYLTSATYRFLELFLFCAFKKYLLKKERKQRRKEKEGGKK